MTKQVYLGYGSLDFSFRKTASGIILFFKGAEVCTSCVVSHTSYWMEAYSPKSGPVQFWESGWGQWRPHPSGQTDCDIRTQRMVVNLQEGGSVLVSCETQQVTVYYRFTFRRGELVVGRSQPLLRGREELLRLDSPWEGGVRAAVSELAEEAVASF